MKLWARGIARGIALLGGCARSEQCTVSAACTHLVAKSCELDLVIDEARAGDRVHALELSRAEKPANAVHSSLDRWGADYAFRMRIEQVLQRLADHRRVQWLRSDLAHFILRHKHPELD